MEDKANPLLALRERSFRLYWLALVAQVIGQQMFAFTLGWLAFEITGSQAQLGFIYLCGFVPQFALTLLGGVLADRIDARKLIRAAQINSAIAMIMVGVAAMLGVAQLWHLALGAFLLGLSSAIDEPARASFFPRLLPRPLLRSAVPLISMAFGSSRMIAPSIAGFLIAAAGAPITFLMSAAAVSTMIAMLFLRSPRAPRCAFTRQSARTTSPRACATYAATKYSPRPSRAALLNATMAMGFIHMLPVFAKDVLEVDSRGLGILASAAGVGALTGFLSYAWVQSRLSTRNVIVGALTVYSVALIGFAFSDWYWLSFCAIVRRRPVPRLLPDLRAGDAANPGRGPFPRAGDGRLHAGMEPDVPERISAQHRGRVRGPAPRARGRRERSCWPTCGCRWCARPR